MSRARRAARATRDSGTHPHPEEGIGITMDSRLSRQRVFQRGDDQFILLTKDGQAVFFEMNERDGVVIRGSLEDVDFKATGTMLRKEGWRCVGPGLEYEWVLRSGQKDKAPANAESR